MSPQTHAQQCTHCARRKNVCFDTHRVQDETHDSRHGTSHTHSTLDSGLFFSVSEIDATQNLFGLLMCLYIVIFWSLMRSRGALAQMVERPLRMREAGGSMPPSSKLRYHASFFFKKKQFFLKVAACVVVLPLLIFIPCTSLQLAWKPFFIFLPARFFFSFFLGLSFLSRSQNVATCLGPHPTYS